MSKRKCNAVSRLHQLKKSHRVFKQRIHTQLIDHQDRFNNMLACQRFINHATLALTEPERIDEYDDWHLGLFLHQRWINTQAQQLKTELKTMQQALR